MTHENSKEAVVSIVDDDEMFVRSTARLLPVRGATRAASIEATRM